MHTRDDWKKSYTKAHVNSIGKGAFGNVWLVRSNRSGKFFAMKEICLSQYILKCSLINKSYALDEGLKLRQLGIIHQNICKYYESFLNNQSIFWIMDYCDGGTLKERIALYLMQEKRIKEDLIWYWSLQILNGLKFLHNRGLIHRDLKPDNIFISLKSGMCKIGDFGLSKVLIDTEINDNTRLRINNIEDQTGKNLAGRLSNNDVNEPVVYKLINLSQVGTPSYMSFE